MRLPLFFIAEKNNQSQVILDEETSKHLVQVLRKKNGDPLQLTNGAGFEYDAVIADAHKKHTTVTINREKFIQPADIQITIAISPIKNTSRFEWFLEKATEIGITGIVPLICERTEKDKLRMPRLKQIIISAMLQSHQSWMPVLIDPISFNDFISNAFYDQKLIAHCEDKQKINLAEAVKEDAKKKVILIGPEGDFTSHEIEVALANEFKPVAIGTTRLRTETAGVAAASLLRLGC